MKKISLLLTMLILFSCQSKTDKKQYQISEETKSGQLSKSEPTSSLSKDLNKKIDDFLFATIETGWLKSTRREGVMYVSARLLVKNISKNEITDIPVLQNQITFNVIENGVIVDDGFDTIHSRVLPPWGSNVSKYKTFTSTGFRNIADNYTEKDVVLEVYYHDKLLWKGKVDNRIVDWED